MGTCSPESLGYSIMGNGHRRFSRETPMTVRVAVDKSRLAEFCERNSIKRLALFGSVLRPEFGPDSDIDVLVEFEQGQVPGLLGIARMERELSALLNGREVDLRTPEDLSRYFRQDVVDEAEVLFERE